MTDRPQNIWMYPLLAVFFLLVGLRDLFKPEPDAVAAVWELGFAAANALFAWAQRGAPRPVQAVGYGLFAVAVAVAVGDLFFDLTF